MKDEMKLAPDLAQVLLGWYDEGHRALPWRTQVSPYRTWISEIMLQQTRVEAVIPYFERFMEALPDIPALAAVDDDRLMKLWEGLGYYSRARNLKKAAQDCMTRFDGALPASYDALITLPGIGDYTAGAIASIACGEAVPAVDGNVLRVFSRLTADDRDILSVRGRAHFRALCASCVPQTRPGDFNQALMELGATVCIPNGAPDCAACPLAAMCRGHLTGTARNYPCRAAKKPRRVEKRTVYLLRREDCFALVRRGPKGVLAGQWSFPDREGQADETAARQQLAGMGLSPVQLAPLPDAKHIFTHIEWQMCGWYALVQGDAPGLCWMRREEIREKAAIPSAYRTYAAAMDALTLSGEVP